MQQEEGMETLTDEGILNLQPSLSWICCPSFDLHFTHNFHGYSYVSGEDEALQDFLTEDREEELKRHQTSMAETRKLVRDVMQKDWGWGEVVHPEKAEELILQVTISF